MNQLVSCSHCNRRISDTALRCPACLKLTGDAESLSRKISNLSAASAVLLLTGPAGIASAILTTVFSLDTNRQLKNAAKDLGCIDSFDLSVGTSIFVTDKEFISVLTMFGKAVTYPGFARHHLRTVSIDEKKSRAGGFMKSERTVLNVQYFDTSRRKEEVVEDYVFEGKGSRASAEIALLKFNEYRLNTIV